MQDGTDYDWDHATNVETGEQIELKSGGRQRRKQKAALRRIPSRITSAIPSKMWTATL